MSESQPSPVPGSDRDRFGGEAIDPDEASEMKIYFERQQRSSGGSRWRLYSIRE